MHWTDRRERYRAHISGNECLHPGSVFDAISARIAEELGFEIGMFAGSIGSFSVLGNPDLILLTLTEFAQQAYRINRAGKLPLMVDADHGYGNALNVMRTIQELETAGVAGIMIEDTVLPRQFGEKSPCLTTIEEGIGKMRAALAAREDKALVIIGRTSAAQIAGRFKVIRAEIGSTTMSLHSVSWSGCSENSHRRSCTRTTRSLGCTAASQRVSHAFPSSSTRCTVCTRPRTTRGRSGPSSIRSSASPRLRRTPSCSRIPRTCRCCGFRSVRRIHECCSGCSNNDWRFNSTSRSHHRWSDGATLPGTRSTCAGSSAHL